MDNQGYVPQDGGSNKHSGMWTMDETQPNRWRDVEINDCTYSKREETTKDNTQEKTKVVGVFEMFRFATCKDRLFLICGVLLAIAQGVSLPVQILLFGGMIDVFVGNDRLELFLAKIDWNATLFTRDAAVQNTDILGQIANEQNLTTDLKAMQDVTSEFESLVAVFARDLSLLGLCVFASVSLSQTLLHVTASNQAKRVRVTLFKAILRQDISWYDLHQIGELNSRLTDDVNKFHEGIGDKIGTFFVWTSSFVAGLVIAFIKGWKMAIVVLAFVPLLALGGIIITKIVTAFTEKELKAYSKAGAIAEEVLGSIRTVYAFGGQKKECERYGRNLKDANKFGERTGMITGLGLGFTYMIMYGTNAVALYWGSKLVREDEDFTPGKMITVLFSVTVGGMSLGNASPALATFNTARAASFALWELMDRVPQIDSMSPKGNKPNSLRGNIELRHVKFRYPARPDVQVMDDVNLSVRNGQTVALVGPSGCGKSTTVQLIQRLYDPEEGAILLDGMNIKELNIKWLRQQIGLVSQEPVLFGTTIGENISYGRDGVTQAEIEQAAREANAHDFISKLPLKYETLVGERGAQLSGGQKQRIAIARALVRNPKILLLDEATSALDTESEATVQAALDKARKGRTTIVIAHRLSTVRSADVIVGIENGKVVEQGTHDQLMDKKGIYFTLVMNQSSGKGNSDSDNEDEEGKVPLKSGVPKRIRSISTTVSMTSYESEKSEALDENIEGLKPVSIARLLRMNSPEWKIILAGCIGAMTNGVAHVVFAILLSEIMAIFTLPMDEQEDRTNTICTYYIALIIFNFIGYVFQGTFMGKSGEALTLRLRNLAFKSYLRQEIAYFDDPKNTIGALTTRLATGASAVKGATGALLALVVQDSSSLGAALAIGFVYSWMLTLGILAFIPFILGSSLLQTKMLGGLVKEGHTALEDASKVALEGIENIRTVAALTREDTLVEWYHEKLRKPLKKSYRTNIKAALAYALSQSMIFFMLAAVFSLIARLVEEGHTTFADAFRVFFAIVFSAIQAGRAASLAPDFNKAKLAAAHIFKVIDREPEIDNLSEEGIKPERPMIGNVEFNHVEFSYPTRSTVPVLQGLNLKVNPGQTLALVGSSGCGKSTTVQLLERFYDPLMGEIRIDGNISSQLNIGWMRSQIGLVSQEPVLFDATIQDNISYGDNSREVPTSDILKAARDANIHDFISKLPEGYQTNVGDKGTQLSGGQKQRIAIARALVRNPKILLLDEATSALDTESEKIVQEALDRAQQGRTSIVIAHRLSTVQNADLIAVIHHGKVVELGTHSELIAQQGKYYKLNNAQLHKK